MPLAIGTVVDSRYEIIAVVGSGAMGAVYKVKDTLHEGKIWALKELAPVYPDPKDQERFKREAKILANLNHPHLPEVDNYFDDQKKFYLVMNFIDGTNLMDLMAKNPNGFPENQIKSWLATILDILNYLHTQNLPIIFRDIKPQNLIVDKNGKLWLVDAGIAVFKQTGSAPIITLGSQAQTGNFATVEYAAPEQDKQADEKTDMFNLGVTIIQLACGKQNLRQHFKLPLPCIKSLCPNISDDLANILRKMTEYYPDDRYGSVQEIITELSPNTTNSKIIDLPHLPLIGVKQLENNIPLDTHIYPTGFRKIPELARQLINYLDNRLYRQALDRLNFLIKIFASYGEVVFTTHDKILWLGCINMLIYCKIGILLKINPKKAKREIMKLGKNNGVWRVFSPEMKDLYIVAEYLEATGKLIEATRVFEQITKKFPNETAAYQAIKRIELLISQQKQQKIAQAQQKKLLARQNRQKKWQIVSNWPINQLKNIVNFATSNVSYDVSLTILLPSIWGAIAIATIIQSQKMAINAPPSSIFWFCISLLALYIALKCWYQRAGIFTMSVTLFLLSGWISYDAYFEIPKASKCQWSNNAQLYVQEMAERRIDDWKIYWRQIQVEKAAAVLTNNPTALLKLAATNTSTSKPSKTIPIPSPSKNIRDSSPLYIPLKTVSPTQTLTPTPSATTTKTVGKQIFVHPAIPDIKEIH